MAIFNTSTAVVLRERMFTDGFDRNTSVNIYPACFLTIHSGSQPLANDVVTGWTNYNYTNTNFLGLATYVTLSETSTSSFTLYAASQTGTVIRSGLAQWAILWSQRTTMDGVDSAWTTSSYASSTPPTRHFMVVPVSDINTTTGIVRLVNTATTVGVAFTISEITFKVGI